MAKLKLGPIADDRPVKLTIELPAAVHRDLVAYAEVLGRETGQPVGEPVCFFEVVSGEEDGDALLLVEPQHLLPHGGAAGGVEALGGLVQEE